MPTYVALLRGINLGRARKVAMPELRAVHERLGHQDVRTYIQSGNVVFGTDQGDEAAIAADLEPALARQFGFEVAVVLRTAAELAEVAERGPYASRDVEPRFVAVTFLDRPPATDPATVIAAAAHVPDEFVLVGREVHQVYPAGMGRSKLPAALDTALAGLRATTRNWRTVTKLLELSGSG